VVAVANLAALSRQRIGMLDHMRQGRH
jgi:hypothetical protein